MRTKKTSSTQPQNMMSKNNKHIPNKNSKLIIRLKTLKSLKRKKMIKKIIKKVTFFINKDKDISKP